MPTPTPTPAPTPEAAGTGTATPAPTATAERTAAPTPTPDPTATGADAPTPTPTSSGAEAFGDGTYLVPSELAPATYAAADTSSRCRIYYDNIYLVASGPGRVTFEVQAAWSSVSISNCETFEAHIPSPLTSFGDGVYLVPSELAPATYAAADTSSRCRIYYDNIYLVASGPGRVTFAVDASWSSIRIRDCGTFELQAP